MMAETEITQGRSPYDERAGYAKMERAVDRDEGEVISQLNRLEAYIESLGQSIDGLEERAHAVLSPSLPPHDDGVEVSPPDASMVATRLRNANRMLNSHLTALAVLRSRLEV